MLRGDHVQGMAAQSGIGTNTLLAAVGATNRYYIDKAIICVTTHQDTGTIYLTDGSTLFVPYFLAKDGNGSVFTFDFGPYGWMSELNATISLGVASAAVACSCTILGRKV